MKYVLIYSAWGFMWLLFWHSLAVVIGRVRNRYTTLEALALVAMHVGLALIVALILALLFLMDHFKI